MAAYGNRARSYNNPSEGSWSCTPDGVCRFIPNKNNSLEGSRSCTPDGVCRSIPNYNNSNHHQQQQGYVMKFETSFEQLQPGLSHGLVVKEPPKPKPVEEFLTRVQTEASQPQAPFLPTSQSPPQRFQIPISSAGHRDNVLFVDNRPNERGPTHGHGGFADNRPNKQDKERGPTHGHGGWDEPYQHHQFIERSRSNNNNDHKGDYWTKETRPPWTHDSRWLNMKSSPPDNRLSRPVNNIDEALEVLKGFAIMPQLPDKEAQSMHSNADVKQPPQSSSSPNRRGATDKRTITSKEAAEKYNGHLVK